MAAAVGSQTDAGIKNQANSGYIEAIASTSDPAVSHPRPANALTEIAQRNGALSARAPLQVDYAKLLFLVADPVNEMRGAMTMTLSSMGANKVEFATRVGDALSRVQRHDVDIILCEYDLEHSADGLHLLEEIKLRNLCKQSMVFIIVTGERRAQNVIGAVELAPDDYLLKPFTGEALSKRLDKAIRKKQEFRCVDDAIRNNEYLRAIEECNRRITDRDEYTLDFMKLKGRLSLQIGDYDGARQVYNNVLAARPIPWAKMGLGKAEYHLKHFATAEQLFNEVLANNGHVMEAYDWLAKTHSAQAEYAAAQAILQNAVKLSPTIVNRQKALGSVAQKNGDFEVAEQAFRDTIDLAKYSFWRDAEHYANLSKVQLAKGDTDAAKKTLAEVRRDFKQDQKATMLSYVMEANVSQQLGDGTAAKLALDMAEKQLAALDGQVPDGYALEFAEACYKGGRDDAANAVVKHVIKNNHDNPDLLSQIEGLFETVGKPELGNQLVSQTTQDIVDLNNQAVKLAKNGDLEGAVQLFIHAVSDMPANTHVTLNAVNALLAYVNTQGWHASYIQLAKEYLERIRKADPNNGKFQKLAETYKATLKRFGNKRSN